ncbi:5-formyltetrahydrofolate cyclo-ligase [Huintestinicola sp.]|uniref:5-formyltetrahydrofolate cyclo-ligase n=1 Tax=Huintestinicola sp. TaxID=2981661 RepID=UPI003D7E458D
MDKIIPMPSENVTDIREYKKDLRTQCRAVRNGMSPEEKEKRDSGIFERITASSAYKQSSIILTYVSTEIEVDTMKLIHKALEDKKRVAVPRCIDGTRDMDFYFIKGEDDLEKGSFGVLEPVPSKCVKAYAFETALCIIPGLAFDMQGYRLGYGKGYYDRFLSAHPRLFKMGICYCSCTCNELIHGRYDIGADCLVTEKYMRRITKERRNGDGR